MTTRIPTTSKTKVRTIQRADGQEPLKVRVAKRSEMAKLCEAAPIQVSAANPEDIKATMAEQLRFQEMIVRWAIVDWGADGEPENHDILGDIAPVDVYDDLTDEEVVQIADIVQGGQLTESQSGN
ncbi:MAG: hypothetical protein NCW75_05540 [Phycisphaera sp.]|nr:MAG: hypothetical protein NCW75_05540 [Phycisphaera sp.]